MFEGTRPAQIAPDGVDARQRSTFYHWLEWPWACVKKTHKTVEKRLWCKNLLVLVIYCSLVRALGARLQRHRVVFVIYLLIMFFAAARSPGRVVSVGEQKKKRKKVCHREGVGLGFRDSNYGTLPLVHLDSTEEKQDICIQPASTAHFAAHGRSSNPICLERAAAPESLRHKQHEVSANKAWL